MSQSNFKRLTVIPNSKLIRNLTLRTLASWIPVNFRWFSIDSFSEEKELGKLLRAEANVIGELKTATHVQYYGMFLPTAHGSNLDTVANNFGFTREYIIDINGKEPTDTNYIPTLETDETFAIRVATLLVQNKVTPQAMLDIVSFVSKGSVNGNLYEPSSDLMFFGDNPEGPLANQLSGKTKLGDENYYHGAVFELQTDGWIKNISSYLNKAKAAGVKYWLALVMESRTADSSVGWFGAELSNDPLALIFPGADFRMNFITDSFEISHESVDSEKSDPYGYYDVVATEIHQSTEVSIFSGSILTWATGLIFSNVPGNYTLTTDMLASSNTGVPSYYTQILPFDPWVPSNIQASVDLHTSSKYFDPDLTLDTPGLIIG